MKLLTLLLFALIFAGGCSTLKELPAAAGKNPCCEKGSAIIRAIAEKNFADYVRFAGETPDISDREKFLESCNDMEKRLGKMEKFSFLTGLKTPEVTSLVYCIDFCRNGSDGKKIEHQQLFQLVFGKVDGKSKLLAMRIM